MRVKKIETTGEALMLCSLLVDDKIHQLREYERRFVGDSGIYKSIMQEVEEWEQRWLELRLLANAVRFTSAKES